MNDKSDKTGPALASESGDQPWHAHAVEDVLSALDVAPDRGLARAAVRNRRGKVGANRLHAVRQRHPLRILLDQFQSVVIGVLLLAAALALALGHWAEGAAVLAVVTVNTAIGFVSEWRARRSMEALRRLRRRYTRVRRNGRERDFPADGLVPGDIVLLAEGDVVPADIRLIEVEGLRADESMLTGESAHRTKAVEPVSEDAPLAERLGMLYRGTVVAGGAGVGVVVATGMATELGRISAMAEMAEGASTPLEQRLDRLGRRLVWLAMAVAVLVAGSGLALGRPPVVMIETAIALGLAAVPEGLPIVATLALARGMWLMARRHALINRLAAVETLGATRVIFSDKTGTLTENRMRLDRVIVAGDGDRTAADGDREEFGPLQRRAVEIGVLCSNAQLAEESDDGKPRGDPTELALLEAGRALGLSRSALLETAPELRELPFDPERMLMATFHRAEGGVRVAVKGAPRAVLAVCDRLLDATGGERAFTEADRRAWQERVEAIAGEGLRPLLVAEKTVADETADPYRDLCLVGLLGLLDPPRSEVRAAIEACHRAGMQVVMVTGDEAATAHAIAARVGLGKAEDLQVMRGDELREPAALSPAEEDRIVATTVFARVSPAQKLRLVEIFQDRGEVVAMTGDGVNDAPALKKADIGVAMGRRGTDAARQASDMILQDDAFASIVAAVEQGRVIFGNIRKSILFMLCTNVAEVAAVALATVAGAPLPLLPLQILYLNVLTDVFPALALGVGRGPEGIMRDPPRDPREPLLTRAHWLAIGGWSALIATAVLAALAWALIRLGYAPAEAVTVSFLTLGFAKLWFVFNLRDRRSSPWRNEITGNVWIWGAIALCALLLWASLHVPGLSDVLQTVPPTADGWRAVLVASLMPLVVGQILLMVLARRRSGRADAHPTTEVALGPKPPD